MNNLIMQHLAQFNQLRQIYTTKFDAAQFSSFSFFLFKNIEFVENDLIFIKILI